MANAKVKVGLVGLGTMGGAVAIRLAEQGVDLTVFDIDVESIDRLRKGTGKPFAVATSLQDLGSRCTIVLCSLAHPDILVEAISGANGLKSGLNAGSIVVDLSTSGPEIAKQCGASLQTVGCEMVDATIGRGPAAALRGELVLMLGGSDAALDRVYPIIQLLAAKVVRCGPLGSAQVIKLANNLVACVNLAVIAEAYQFVKAHGADPALLLDVMNGTYADSFQLQHSVSTKAVKGNFDIVFRLDLAAKDLQLVADASRSADIGGKVGSAALGWYADAVKAGHGKRDWAAVMLIADPALQSAETAS